MRLKPITADTAAELAELPLIVSGEIETRKRRRRSRRHNDPLIVSGEIETFRGRSGAMRSSRPLIVSGEIETRSLRTRG